MLTVPALCWLCQMPLAMPGWGICSFCQRLPRLPVCCPQCGLPSALADVSCGRCLQKPPPWQGLICVADYTPPLDVLVHRLKFRQQTALVPALARLLLLRVLDARRTRLLPAAQLILSVPLHKRRQWWRGYNHSDLLARWLAGKLGCPFSPSALVRVRHTPAQHQLKARVRKRNVKNAFTLCESVAGRHVALVDDVVTTGSTVAEIARLLMRAGAESVQIWCLCRTLSLPVDRRMITNQPLLTVEP